MMLSEANRRGKTSHDLVRDKTAVLTWRWVRRYGRGSASRRAAEAQAPS